MRAALLVVAGIFVKRGRLLLSRRAAGASFPLLWEFPGGKVDPGEGPEEALAREWTEELDVRIAGLTPYTFTSDAPLGAPVTILFYRVRALSGEPRPVGCDAVRWCEPREAELLAVPPADALVRARLVEDGSGRFLDTEGIDTPALLAALDETSPLIAGSDDLGHGPVKFTKRGFLGRERLDGILIETPEGPRAYQNLCPHVPMPLDRAEEGLVTDDGCHLLCRTHGAIFAPESGLCLAGPCRGESLESIAIVRAGSGWAVKT